MVSVRRVARGVMPDASGRMTSVVRVVVVTSVIRRRGSFRATTRAQTCRPPRTACRVPAIVVRRRPTHMRWRGPPPVRAHRVRRGMVRVAPREMGRVRREVARVRREVARGVRVVVVLRGIVRVGIVPVAAIVGVRAGTGFRLSRGEVPLRRAAPGTSAGTGVGEEPSVRPLRGHPPPEIWGRGAPFVGFADTSHRAGGGRLALRASVRARDYCGAAAIEGGW